VSAPEGSAARARATAAQVVLAVARAGRTLEDALAAVAPAADMRPTVQSLAFGAVRWFHELDACLALLSGRPPGRLDPEVRALALVGLYQLAHGATPPYAAVAETVEASRVLRRPRAAGLLNAILRRFLREREAVLAAARRDPEARHAHPAWLIEAFAGDWPQEVESILAAGNAQPPLWLRVNARRGDAAGYRQRLAEAGLDAEACPFAPEALKLSRPVDVARLPGFTEGDVSVQDAAAQLAARLLGARPGMRVLDACAAPGGKTCHLLELAPGLAEVVALDVDAPRAARIRENLGRLGLEAEVRTGDACEPSGWWDGRPFDRILVDAPCSGTGVIRRHPDIKLLRQPADIPAFAARQRDLLESAWRLLVPGGRLLYATCSVLKAENAVVVRAFLDGHGEAVEVTESARLFLPAQPPATGPGPGLALLTGAADTDGFYYACLEKRA
jgi:16S rRNA (cytosine967-C5)-methyltransferase